MRLKERVIIITGAGQGIGRVFAYGLAYEGAKIVVAEINNTKGQEVANDIKDKGHEATFVLADVSSEESTKAMAEATIERYGRIDVLINNAAYFATLTMKPFIEISSNEWDTVLAVNLKGVFLCCKAVTPFMKNLRKGKIINISSATVLFGRPYYAHYVASKAGVIGLTRVLARELGEWNISVNCITPGSVQTEIVRETMTPELEQHLIKQQCIKRRELPEDLLGIVVLLASDESDFISGQVINVDGGHTFH